MNYKVFFNFVLSSFLVASTTSCNENEKGIWKKYSLETALSTTNSVNLFTPFNTIITISSFYYDYEKDIEKKFKSINTISEENFIRIHKLSDRENDYYILDDNKDLITNIHTINNSYGTGNPIKCSDELYELLKLSVKGYELTDGYFNIFTGTLTNYWEDILTGENSDLITDDDPYYSTYQRNNLEHIMKTIPQSIDDVNKLLVFNDTTKEVTFNDIYDIKNNDDLLQPLLSVGGVAKGYATDVVKTLLKEQNYTNCFINSGQSSITTTGKPIFSKNAGGQQISILDPSKYSLFSKDIAFSIKVDKEYSFSTSGNYTFGKSYSFKDDDGNMIYRHHIINPKTGYPESMHRSISILSNTFSNAYMDMFSTAMMNLNIEDGFAFKNKILSEFDGYDLEIFYIDQYQEKQDEKEIDKIKVYASSNINNTLQITEGVGIEYEK